MEHPGTPALAARVGDYLGAFDADEGLRTVLRDLVTDARERVAADWARVQEPVETEALIAGASDDEICRLLVDLAECPPGSLGRSFHDFYRRHGFPLPVEHVSLIAHDFVHVLGGYEPTPEGELALQAMLVAATRGGRHCSALMASLLVFEVGLPAVDDIVPTVAVLDRPGAAELFADGVARGLGADQDLQALDHFALADRDLVELRVELGIEPPPPGPSTFVV